MYDQWEYQIPANTSEENLKEEKLRISLGILTDIYIGFPSGCGSYDSASGITYNLARCRIMHLNQPIAPRSGKSFIAADNYVVHAGPLRFPVLVGDAILTWQLWNLDDTYPHRLWIGINWLTKKELEREAAALESMNVSLLDLSKALKYVLLGETTEESAKQE